MKKKNMHIYNASLWNQIKWEGREGETRETVETVNASHTDEDKDRLPLISHSHQIWIEGHISGHTRSCSGILHSMTVWLLVHTEGRECNNRKWHSCKERQTTGAEENLEKNLDQIYINIYFHLKCISRGVCLIEEGEQCTLRSGALSTWRGRGTLGRAVGVWLLHEVTVAAALTWSTQSWHIPMMQWGVGGSTIKTIMYSSRDWNRTRI